MPLGLSQGQDRHCRGITVGTLWPCMPQEEAERAAEGQNLAQFVKFKV